MTEPAAPRPAATVILLRPGAAAGAPEVFLVRRGEGAAFMGGAHVFPGGRVDPADATVPAAGDAAAFAARLGEEAPETALAVGAAAARELFEEAGALLARDVRTGADPDLADPARRARLSAARRALAKRETTFRAFLEGEGLAVDLGALHFFARWVTPEVEPRRFDARFFLAACPAGAEPVHDEAEVFEGVWLEPAEALRRADRGEIALPPPTLWNLLDLAPLARVEDALAAADARTVVVFRPRARATAAGQIVLVLAGDPDYDRDGFDATEPPLEAQRRFLLEGTRWVARRGGGGRPGR